MTSQNHQPAARDISTGLSRRAVMQSGGAMAGAAALFAAGSRAASARQDGDTLEFDVAAAPGAPTA